MTDLLANPEFKLFIEEFEKLSKTSQQLSLDESRKLSDQFFVPSHTVYERVHRVENIEIEGKNRHKIPVRLFIPNDSKGLPIIVYFHRGGWVFGNIDIADPVCRKFANHGRCIVAAVGYRLAPENPFPTPLEDCYEATKWIAAHANLIGGDPNKIITGGESAGGNLAAAVALLARDQNGPKIASQLLIYPTISSAIQEEIFDKSVDRYFLTKDAMKFFWSMYLQSSEDFNNPYASPDLTPDFSNLPPALIITAEYDPLHQEGAKYAEQLHQAGIKTTTKCFSKVIHGFLSLPIYEEYQKVEWVKEICHLLKRMN